ncbi:MAG TPA: endonuclease III [Candidatus Polarisedimenticolaceae bacterium]|nr:endonuclease III [Candidatus Polarisedimenticolaceae bacterium]
MRAAEKARVQRIEHRLKKLYPDSQTELKHKSALQLLVATILSAQCTDERVNQVTPALFRRYKTAADFASADPPELEALIRPTGFFRNKAKSVMGLGKALVADHKGKVPDRMEDLVKLPGVGRKTANVLLGSWFGRPAIPVDTHVIRVSGRLALTRSTDPVEIEQDLAAILPERDWTFTSSALIWHGRRVCYARNPACERCALLADCPFGHERLGDRFAILPASKVRGGGTTEIASGGSVPKHRR